MKLLQMGNLLRSLHISIILLIYLSCTSGGGDHNRVETMSMTVEKVRHETISEIIPGAERIGKYVPLLKGKKVGLVVNQTSKIRNKHVLDSLLELDIKVMKVFAPEHGFRGDADAGAHIEDGKDAATGVPIISLYGSKRAPSKDDLVDLDILIYDIQDVGVRFYTFISTMHHVMQACIDNQKPLIILDRPNPNGYYFDGPVLDMQYQSFVGMHPIPVVYGLTCGELSEMINGEGWLKNGEQCNLTVVPCLNYNHNQTYDLPVKPSPNLPNLRSILLYPSLCFFEPTIVSIGRGTQKQFQVVGHPNYHEGTFSFIPSPQPGAMSPKLNGEKCIGIDLTDYDPAQIMDWKKLNLSFLIGFYEKLQAEQFVQNPAFFDKLAGSDQLRKQLEAGMSEENIRDSWTEDLKKYEKLRERYLIYD